MNAWIALVTLLAGEPAPVRAPILDSTTGWTIQAIQIPDENLVDQIRRYIPGEAQSMSLAALAELMERHRLRQTWRNERRPVEGRLIATIDPISGRLTGTSQWSIGLGEAPRVSFRPWNMLVRTIRVLPDSEGPTLWGATEESALYILPTGKKVREVEVEWEQQGIRRAGGFDYRLRLPNSSLNSLELTEPADWLVRSSTASKRGADLRSLVLLADATGTIAFSLVPSTGGRGPVALSSGRSRVECLVDQGSVLVRATIEVSRVGSGERGVRLLIDGPTGSLEPRSDQLGDWTLEKANADETVWLFEPSESSSGRLVIEFEGRISASQIDRMSERRWLPPRVRLADGDLLSEEIDVIVPRDYRLLSVSTGSFQIEGTDADDAGRLRISFRGTDRSVRPTFAFARRQPVVLMDGGMHLDLLAQPPRVTGTYRLTLESGELRLLEARIPAGWNIVSGKLDPGGAIATVSSEVLEDGRSSVWLLFPRPVSIGIPTTIELVAESDQIARDGAVERRISLPEMTLVGVEPTGRLEYRLQMDPEVPCNLEELPMPRAARQDERAAGSEAYTFEYLSPLPATSITIQPPLPRFRARLQEQVRRRSSDWRQEWLLDLEVLQGSLETLHIVSNHPLPREMTWSVVGNENSVVAFEQFPESTSPVADGVLQPQRERAPDDEPSEESPTAEVIREYHYQLRTSLPVRKSIRLSASLNDPSESLDPPLLQLPDAEDFLARVNVESRSGRVINVESNGLIAVSPDSGGDGETDSTVWSGQYGPLEKQASLRLNMNAGQLPLSESMGRAVIRCTSRLESLSAVQIVELVLDNSKEGPLRVRLPADSYVWQVLLDGVSRTPGIRDGMLEVVPSLEPGVHACRLVFSAPTRLWFGLTHVSLPLPLEGWDTIASSWTIERNSGAYLFTDPALRLASNLQTIERIPDDPIITLTDEPASRETIGRLRNAFAGLTDAERSVTGDVLSVLSNSLLSGGISALGRRALVARPLDETSGETLSEWLRARQIWIIVVDTSMMVTRRAATFLGGEVRRNWNWERWTREIIDQVRTNGISDDLQFISAIDDEGLVSPLPPNEFELSAARRVSWSYVVTGPSDGKAYDVLLVSRELLSRLSRLGVISSMVLVFIISRHWSIAAHRRLLAGLLLVSLGVAGYGGWAHELFSVPLWTAVATSVALLLIRIVRPRQSRSMPPSEESSVEPTVVPINVILLILSLVVTSPARSDEAKERVLIPVSPTGDVKQVIVSESLLGRLREDETSRDRVLVERSEYRGEPGVDGRYRWRGTLVGSVERSSTGGRVTLPLLGVETKQLSINGIAVANYRSGGLQEGIEFVLPTNEASEKQTFRVEVEFESNGIGQADEKAIQFRVPPSSVTDVRLSLDREVLLDEASRTAGWQTTVLDGKHFLTKESGPVSMVAVRWRSPSKEGEAFAPIGVESIRLVEVKSAIVDLLVIYRLSLSGGRHELVFPISKRFIPSDVEGEGIRDWRIEPVGDDRRAIHVEIEPGLRTRELRIRGEVAIDPAGPFVVPEVSLMDAGIEKGVLGITTKDDWRATLVDGGSAVTSSDADFLATWSRLSRELPPSAVQSVLRWEQSPGETAPPVTFEIRKEQSAWQVEQELSATLDPIWKVTTLEAKIRVKANPGRKGPLVMELPAGAKISRAAGPLLQDWIEQMDSVSFFLKSAGSEEILFDLTARIPWELTSKRITARTTHSLAPIRWSDAASTLTRWQIRTTPGWTLMALDEASGQEPTRSESLVRQTSSLETLSVQLSPEPRELSAETLTRVVVRDRQTEIEGIIQLHVDRGTMGRLEFRTRGGLRNIQWEVDKMSPPVSEERGGERVWVYVAGRSVTGDLTLRWRTSKLYDGSESTIPRVIIDAPARVRDWVSVVNLTDRKLNLQTPGLTANPLPPTLLSHGGPLGEVSTGIQTFLADTPQWQLSFSLDSKRASTPPFQVIWADHDILVGQQGRIRGRTTWEWIDQQEGTLEISKPAATTCDSLTANEQPLTSIDATDRGLLLPIFRTGRVQRLVMEWSCPIAEAQGDLPLPVIRSEEGYPTLLRLRHGIASPIRLASDGAIDRVTWLTVRLDRLVDDVTQRFSPMLGSREQVELIQDLAMGRDWENEILSLLRGRTKGSGLGFEQISESEVDEARISMLVEKRRLLESQVLERWGNESVESVLAESQWLWNATENLPTADISYHRSTSPAESIRVEFRRALRWRHVTSNELVRIGVSALTLVLVLVNRLWLSMRLYWPAPMITAGLAWILFADSPLVGWCLLLVAVVGAVRAVRRWLDVTVLDFVSTVLVRSSHHQGTAGTTVRRNSL